MRIYIIKIFYLSNIRIRKWQIHNCTRLILKLSNFLLTTNFVRMKILFQLGTFVKIRVPWHLFLRASVIKCEVPRHSSRTPIYPLGPSESFAYGRPGVLALCVRRPVYTESRTRFCGTFRVPGPWRETGG